MKDYLEGFFKDFEYPAEAASQLLADYDKICACGEADGILSGILSDYERDGKIDAKELIPKWDNIAELTGIHGYTVRLLVHICLTKELKRRYEAAGLDKELWAATVSDFKYKLMECHIVKGIWGTFVADGNWFSRWYDLTRFAFDRLQFEVIPFRKEYEKKGVKLGRESKVLNVHIPRTGTSLKHEQVLASYNKAREFYKEEFGDEPIAFVCSSWLLFPEQEKILDERSNIRKFMSDYDIIESGFYPPENKNALWRIFDCPDTTPIEELPENSFLQKAYKEYLQNGGRLGFGYGVIV